MRIDVLTTFPEMFAAEPPAALGVSIPARARAAGIVEVVPTDIRAYAENKHAKTDDRPFGGGPGMVMMCQPIWDAVRGVEASDPRPAHRVLLTPQGRPLTQASARHFQRIAGQLHPNGVHSLPRQKSQIRTRAAPQVYGNGQCPQRGGQL